MARTKNTARKSTGGRVPRGRLAHREEEPQHVSDHALLEDTMDTADSLPQFEEIPSYEAARDWEDEWIEPPQEENPQGQEEEAPEEQEQPMDEAPQDEQAPAAEEQEQAPAEEEEEPFYRRVAKTRKLGEPGGVPGQLRGMLQRLGIANVPEFVVKRVPRPGRDTYTARVDIYDRQHLLSTHYSPTPWLTEDGAVSDAAWEAVTYYSYVYRHRLAGTVYALFPRRRRGRGDYTLAPLPAEVPRRDMVLNLSDRLQSALGEIRALEEMLRNTEATLRARLRMQQGEDSDLYSSEARTWTATSLDQSMLFSPAGGEGAVTTLLPPCHQRFRGEMSSTARTWS